MAQHAGAMMPAWMPMLGPLRLALLAALSCSYLLVCLLPWLRHRRQRHQRSLAAQQVSAAPTWIIAYASQTGTAEQLAVEAAAHLRRAGIGVRLCELASLMPQEVRAATRMLFLVGTYGEGDAPDNAALFVDRVMAMRLPLPHLQYALLALGDSSYRHYCGFGRALDRWLGEQGAQALFERIDVDRSAPAALAHWRARLGQLSGAAPAAGAIDCAFVRWRLIERRLLNAGSAGAPLYHVVLEQFDPGSPDRPVPHWQSGDLAQIAAPLDPAHPRDYSIASIPADGRIELLVRLHRDSEGRPGLASGWLALQANIGDAIALRLRQHRRFRLEGNGDRALILIGNGSGIAGLRAHLKAREQSGQGRNWLVFGERNAAFDSHCRSDIVRWQENGVLERLDLVFSRDQEARIHVQHRLLEHADGVRNWVAQGAALYVCGALVGMAGGVDDALASILGRASLDALAADGRYRRDVY